MERNSRNGGRGAAAPAHGRVWRAAAEDGFARTIAGGAAAYDRRRTLPRLIGLDPRELDGDSAALDRRIRTRLARALRAERRRGAAGHWTYDVSRHLALAQAIAGEAVRATQRRKVDPAPAQDAERETSG